MYHVQRRSAVHLLDLFGWLVDVFGATTTAPLTNELYEMVASITPQDRQPGAVEYLKYRTYRCSKW